MGTDIPGLSCRSQRGSVGTTGPPGELRPQRDVELDVKPPGAEAGRMPTMLEVGGGDQADSTQVPSRSVAAPWPHGHSNHERVTMTS